MQKDILTFHFYTLPSKDVYAIILVKYGQPTIGVLESYARKAMMDGNLIVARHIRAEDEQRIAERIQATSKN